MNNRKTVIRFFTIADYEEEEAWLHEQHKNGWKLSKMIPPCFYIFEQCTPENVAYRLDYKNNTEKQSLFSDVPGLWLGIYRAIGWVLYFRKPLSETNSEQDGEIFSDNESRVELINHVMKTRLLPLMIIFLCCVFPNFIKSMETSDSLASVFTVLFAVLTLLYLYLFVYCGLKLRKLREKIQK